MKNIYQFRETDEIVTPALVYYRDIIREHIQKAVSMAGEPGRLWPHVKTHKMSAMIRLQMEYGITRFKCATIAEAEMAASCGAENVLLAYPLIGPNISRFFKLTMAFPEVVFWAIGDNAEQVRRLGQTFSERGKTAAVLADVNMGMNRTGVPLNQAEDFYLSCHKMEGISMRGLHCYDGHRTEHDFEDRKQEVQKSRPDIRDICRHLEAKGFEPPILVMGGSPSMPCHRDLADQYTRTYFSPGTFLVNDYGYSKKFPDLDFTPGAAVLTRVISCPERGHFTLDLGYKGIASDPEGTRGIIAGMEHVNELFQSEEHWAFSMEPGFEEQCPRVGDELFVIPTHICPTSALYPSVPVVEGGHICATWQVTARNRKITY